MGLNHTLNIGSEALKTSRQGVDTASHNISNAQVEGYSRQRVNAKARHPLERNGLIIGNGVYVENISRAHDNMIEKQLVATNQEASMSSARHETLSVLETVFSPELSANISDEIGNFFNSMQDLANFPEELTARTAAKQSAQNLAASFRRTDNDLRRNQGDFNDKIIQEAQEINDICSAIGTLNIRIKESEIYPGAEANDLRDQQEKLLRDLSGKIEISHYEDGNGMLFIRGPNQVTLVDRGNSAKVFTKNNPERGNMADIVVSDWEGGSERNITDAIHAGALSSYLEARDRSVPVLMEKTNALAYGLMQSVNAAHRMGYGLKEFSETTGRDFFAPLSDPSQAAAQIQLSAAVSETTDAISCASSPNAPGDNVVLNSLLSLKDTKLLDGGNATFTEFYSNLIGQLGVEASRAEHVKDADDILMGDLKARREAVSGVSLDEEAMEIMKWQASFTAASKVITTIDEMYETVLSLKR